MLYIYSWAFVVIGCLLWGVRGYFHRQRSVDIVLNLMHQRIEQLEEALDITVKDSENLNG